MILMIKYFILYKVFIKSNPSKLILIFDDSLTNFRIILVFLINPHYFIIDRVIDYIYINIFAI